MLKSRVKKKREKEKKEKRQKEKGEKGNATSGLNFSQSFRQQFFQPYNPK